MYQEFEMRIGYSMHSGHLVGTKASQGLIHPPQIAILVLVFVSYIFHSCVEFDL